MTHDYLDIIAHYESCLDQHGDTHRGVDWPNRRDVETRYQVMLELIPAQPGPYSLLDFGCGAAHLYEFIQAKGKDGLQYSGLDLSDKFIQLCKAKYPCVPFYHLDLLHDSERLPSFDYIVMNGVFTEKRSLSFADMFAYFQTMIRIAFSKAHRGLAFNVMSKHVDWERDDLFHVPFDLMADFLYREVTRKVIFRADYGLYEYTVYLYK